MGDDLTPVGIAVRWASYLFPVLPISTSSLETLARICLATSSVENRNRGFASCP
jgi:hypothetical protein